MANPERGEVALTISERIYVLILDIEAIGAIERGSGVPLADALAQLAAADYTARIVHVFLVALLSRRHPQLTASMIGEIVAISDMATLRPIIFEAVRVAFPDPREDGSSNPEAPRKEQAVTRWIDLAPDWIEAGYNYELFWRSTPRQIERHLIAAKKRREREAEQRRADLWLMAALVRADRLPDFEAFVHPNPERPKGSLAERMRQTMERFAPRDGFGKMSPGT